MKRVLILLLLAGTLLTLVFTGITCEDEPLAFDTISALMTSGGVQVEGYHLEGWAVIRDPGEPASIWRERKLGEKLGLQNTEKRTIPTSRGDCFQVVYTDRDLDLRASILKNEGMGKEDLCYILIKCILPAGSQDGLAWEKKIRDTLSSLGKDHGIYLTVQGKLGVQLDEDAQLAWGQAIFRSLGAAVTDTLRTSEYLSLTGYAAALPDAALAGGKEINLNLSLVPRDQETRVYLGTPVISCEY